MNRRELLKMGLLTGAAAAVTTSSKMTWGYGGFSGDGGTSGGSSSGGNRVPDNLKPSPPTRPFVMPLAMMPVLQQCTQADFTRAPITAENCLSPDDCVKRQKQYYNKFYPQRWYQMEERVGTMSMSPDLPIQTFWGFNGIFPGPTIVSNYGVPELVRLHNKIDPSVNLGFGLPSTTTHLHNGHTASESDGFPTDYLNSGDMHDHHYPNCLPGFSMSSGEDPREALSTLWYHDHRMDFTAQNTYAGLVGYHLLFDNLDTGDETTGLHLPSGKYDVPLIIADRAFDPNTGLLFFDLFNFDGMLGDKYLVNGIIQPFFEVSPRRYRFRLLGPGPSRFWEFCFKDENNNMIPFYQIAEDGNLLPNPVQRTSVRQGPAERTDVIIDFSKFAGKTLYLVNILEQMNGRGPTGNILAVGDKLMQIRVTGPVVADNSVAPSPTMKLRDLPQINMNEVVATRTWRIERANGGWAINGQLFDPNRISAHVKQNTAEVWVLQNNSGSWSHPVHIHFEEFRILSRNGAAPPAWEKGRKDVIKLGPNEEVKFFMRFRDWTGQYPMHCHNTVHEDHAMMIRWQLES